MANHNPIGVFDSGIGGLSVLKEIRALLPGEHLHYVADTAHLPYGDKPVEYILQRTQSITRFLNEQGAKSIVVACNTATAFAVNQLRQEFTLPIVAMEPAVKPAANHSSTGRVGVLATEGTLKSARFSSLIERYAEGAEVIAQPCPGLVEQIEAGNLTSPVTRKLITGYTNALLAQNIDTIVLGCTHYPFLRDQIEQITGPNIKILDTGAAVARHLRTILENQKLLAPETTDGTEYFWTSGPAQNIKHTLERLWQADVGLAQMPPAYCT